MSERLTLATELRLAIAAVETGIRVNTDELDDAVATIKAVCIPDGCLVRTWNMIEGVAKERSDNAPVGGYEAPSEEACKGLRSGLKLLEALLVQPAATVRGSSDNVIDVITVMRNFHLLFEGPGKEIAIAMTQLVVRQGIAKHQFLVALMPAEAKLPPEVAPLFSDIDHELPGEEELNDILEGCYGDRFPNEHRVAVIKAALGMTRLQAERAFARSKTRYKDLSVWPGYVWRLKAQLLNKEGLVEIHETPLKFTDVGGLEGLKDFLRRILAPDDLAEVDLDAGYKGILCAGVPGVGKSLVAYCVGNEFGLPTLLANPGNLMGRFVGQSVAGWEEVLIDNPASGRLERFTFEQLAVNGPDEYGTLTCDNTSAAMSYDATTVVHDRESELYTVKTVSGREITVTGDHSLFSVRDEQLVEVACCQLKPNMPIAVTGSISFPEVSSFVLEPSLEDAKYWIANTADFDRDKLRKIVGSKNVCYYERAGGVPIRRLRQAGVLVQEAKPCSQDAPYFRLDVPYTVDVADCQLLGFWLANGDFNRQTLRLHVNEQDQDEVAAAVSVKWPTTPGKWEAKQDNHCATVYVGRGARRFMSALWGTEITQQDCYTKRVPSIVFQLPHSLRAEVLSAYICSDGYFGYHGFEVTTASRGLANDLLLLFSTFGIVATHSIHSESKLHRIHVQGTEQLRQLYALLSFSGYSRKQVAFSEALLKRHPTRKNRECRTPTIIPGKPFAVDRVAEIILVSGGNRRVYDVSVPGYEKFISGFGGVWAHNTESNTRRFFQIVERMSPCICVIDEVSQVMPASNNASSDVSSRMLGTFLSKLNDSQAPIFWFFTSNDVTKMHEAFLRAERVDACFYVMLPTPEERAAIWKTYIQKFFPQYIKGKASPRFIATDPRNIIAEHAKTVTDIKEYADKLAAAMMTVTPKEREEILAQIPGKLGSVTLSGLLRPQIFEDDKWTPAEIRACCRLARRLRLTIFEASKRVGHKCTGERGTALIENLDKWAKDEGALSSRTGEVLPQGKTETPKSTGSRKRSVNIESN